LQYLLAVSQFSGARSLDSCAVNNDDRASRDPRLNQKVCGTMRAYKNRRRAEPRIESLEGKTLLSTAPVLHRAALNLAVAPIVAQAAQFGGTLTGFYSNAHIPFAGYLLSYSTSGTLSGVGSTRLHGSLFARPGARVGRLAGQFVLRESGGSMIVNVFQSATPGSDRYKVVRASGTDTAYKGGTGGLTISQSPTFSAPYYISGQATMTFTPS
jgi:hypothetical protein